MALWPVLRVLVAFSFGFLVVRQTALIFIFESWNFKLEDVHFTGKNPDYILLPVCLCFEQNLIKYSLLLYIRVTECSDV